MVYTKIDNSYIPEENKITNNLADFKANSAPPKGYGRITSVPTEASKIAKSLLSGEFGTLTPFQVGERNFIARVEPHYHDPKSGIQPSGWHKGVSIFESLNNDKLFSNENTESESNKLLSKLNNFLSENI